MPVTEDSREPQAVVDDILFDGRGLQAHARASRRAIDFDVALLTAIRHRDWSGPRPRLVGLVDHAAEPLREHHRLLFDDIATGRHRTGGRSRCFIASAPMAHDPVWALPILLDSNTFKVAAVQELVSVEQSAGHPSTLERRADHLACFAWLGRYDLFCVGSQGVKAELEQFRAIDPSKIVIAGRVVSSSVGRRFADRTVPFKDRRHIAVTVDDDDRDGLGLKTVLSAHARSRIGHRFPLLVLGPCPTEMRGRLRTHYASEGGAQENVSFVDGLPGTELADLHRSALLTVIPSWGSEAQISSALESAALGTPAVVPETPGDADVSATRAFTYPRGDGLALARVFDAAIGDVARWDEAREVGMAHGPLHSAAAVAHRLLDRLVERVTERPPAPAVRLGIRPRLAMLTPLPPARSGAAVRSAAAMVALSRYVDVHAFSDTPGAVATNVAWPIAPVRAFELGPEQFDASLSVLGQSGGHVGIFEHLLANGGAALTHDAHLVGLYAETFGVDRAMDVGREERGGDVMQDEIAQWTREPRDMPILFMSEVARAAAPLLVTSDVAVREMRRLYGVEPKRLPPLQHRTFDPGLLTREPRLACREALGWARDEVVLCSFGLRDAEAAVVVWALRLLRDWRLDARLVLGRFGDGADRTRTDRLVQELDLTRSVVTIAHDLPERAYVDHLVAADMAVQLGTHLLSGPSRTMMDCIAASLPTIANDHVSSIVAAPPFVRRVPDALSPVLVAEAALDIVSSGHHRTRPVAEAQAYAAAYSPDHYARAMTQALGLDIGRI